MIKEILGLLKNEIKWCEENSIRNKDNNYKSGFIKGLKQAILLIKEYRKAISAQEEKEKEFKETK